MNVGGRCRPSSTNAKNMVSTAPSASMPTPKATTERRSAGPAKTCRTPEEISSFHCVGTRTGGTSATRIRASAMAATANDAMSTSATATPPAAAKRPAPISGPHSRSDWRTLANRPFVAPSSSSGTISLISPANAPPVMLPETP